MNEMESKYFRLLHKLVESKMQAEAETSAAVDFKDLRVDLRNIIETELLRRPIVTLTLKHKAEYPI